MRMPIATLLVAALVLLAAAHTVPTPAHALGGHRLCQDRPLTTSWSPSTEWGPHGGGGCREGVLPQALHRRELAPGGGVYGSRASCRDGARRLRFWYRGE